tara:strand:+ start:2451 stop:2999 length:549 start_codon:yes stop_codon:yes gene_type:complete
MKDLVWSYNLKNHNDIKSNLLDTFKVTEKRIEKNDLDSITYTDFRNNNHHTERPYFATFANILDDFAKDFMSYYCVENFTITNCWFQQYYKNDNHSWHNHGQTNISWVYYVELNDKNYNTEFYDTTKKQKFTLDVKEGDIVVFPSFIPHRSPAIVTNDRKTIISCNVNLLDIDTNLMNIDVV